jgi:hypothetical protein
MVDIAALTQAALVRFHACRVTSRDRVVILASTANDPRLVEAYRRAAVLAGADPLLITYLDRPPYSGVPEPVVRAAGEADVIADLNPAAWAQTNGQASVLRALHERNGRWVWPAGFEEDHVNFLRTPPGDPLVVARAQILRRLIDGANRIRFTSREGTDLTIIRDSTAERFPSIPHYWNEGGMFGFAARAEGANGTIVLVGALRTQSPRLYKRQITSPMRLDVRHGQLAKIDDANVDARFLRDWVDSLNGMPPQLVYTSIGFDHRVTLPPLDSYALHSYLGGILFSFGTNSLPIGGEARGHLDMLLVGSSCWVDNLKLIEDGNFTEESRLLNPL